MKGNFHVQFLGEGVAATSPPYPTPGWATTQVYPGPRPARERQSTISDVPFALLGHSGPPLVRWPGRLELAASLSVDFPRPLARRA